MGKTGFIHREDAFPDDPDILDCIESLRVEPMDEWHRKVDKLDNIS